MNNSLFSLLILSVFSLLHLATSLCAPRSYPHSQVLTSFLPPPTTSPTVRSISSYAPASSPFPSPIKLPQTISLSLNPTTLSNADDVASNAMTSLHSTSSNADNFASETMTSLHSTPSNADDFASGAMKSLQDAIVGPSVKSICKQTDYPDICDSAIQSISPFLAKADPRTILKVAMKGAMAATRVAMDVSGVLVNKPNIDKTTRSILGVCSDGFEDAINDLQEAMKALDGNDMGTMNSMLSALFSDYGGCGDAFTDVKANSPLKAYEELLYKHASNCMALGQLI